MKVGVGVISELSGCLDVELVGWFCLLVLIVVECDFFLRIVFFFSFRC